MIASQIEQSITTSSWIRKMFDEGARLKARHGNDNVFDFSLGNPNLPPPPEFHDALETAVKESRQQGHGYMPNAGYPAVREVVARTMAEQQNAPVTADDIVITSGAAGGLNVALKAVLNPGEVVLVPRPFFVEYTFYAANHGGILETVPTHADFTLDIEAFAAAITDKTRVVIINSPNNPTGQIYSRESLDALGRLLAQKSAEYGREIYLISDEPYRKIVFDQVTVPPVFDSYKNTIVVTSHSKDLSLAGERIGCLVVHPEMTHRNLMHQALALTNRILGFVNAPALMQRVLPMIQESSVDIDAYRRKRDLFCQGLEDAGLSFVTPPGAFYIFPRAPIADDVAFVKALQEELILAVPGSGFGGPGHFRLAFCVADQVIERSLPAFKRVMENF